VVLDDDQARAILQRPLDGVASGSHPLRCDGTNVISEAGIQARQDDDAGGAVPYRLRRPEQIAGCFEGLELVESGVVSCPRWRPDAAELASGSPAEMDQFAGVGGKPS
jgi:hypothetical protein